MDNTIEQAQSQEVFDVLAFIESTAYPVENVVVFQDAKAATDYLDTIQKRDAVKDDEEKYKTLNNKVDELAASIEKSSMIFELRGMPPGIVTTILAVPEGEDEELHATDRENELIARTIISVRNSQGAKDNRVWDAAAVQKLRNYLKEGEFGKLINGVAKVNFNAMVFDEATDAGFSGRSIDVA